MKVKPLGDRALVKTLEAETKTKGGIYIPDTAQEKTNDAEVVAIGESKDIVVKVGDHVLYESYSGTKIKIEGEEYILLKNENILAVVEK